VPPQVSSHTDTSCVSKGAGVGKENVIQKKIQCHANKPKPNYRKRSAEVHFSGDG